MATYPTVELKVGSTWTDITTYVRYQDMIQISRGRRAEASQADASSCSMTLDNRDGRFSPRNPEGPYYGFIGRNTPIRVSIDGGLPYLNLTGAASSRATTPDNAALDVTGDLDVRVEMFLLDWNVTAQTEVIGKYLTTGNQRSWRFFLDTGGYPTLTWSNDGSTLHTSTSTSALATNGRNRMAIRFTIDVNDGSGNNVVKFYTADTLGGTYTQLGSTVTTVGTTSIFSSTATLDIGDINNSTLTPMTGRVYKAQMRNGIAGSVVANPDFTAQTVGATSFADSAGRTWSVTSPASVSNRKIRFEGEVASWPVEWDISGKDVVTKIEAAGITRRLTQTESPLRSPLYREFTNPTRTHILSYWPMEDSEGSTTFAAGITGQPPSTWGGIPTLASASDWPGSTALPVVNDGIIKATVPTYTTTGQTATRMLVKVPAAGVVAESMLFSLTTTGTVKRWEVHVNTAGSLKVFAYDGENNELLGSVFFAFAVNGKLKNTLLELTQSGANIDWRINLTDYTDSFLTSDTISGASVSATLAGYTVGRVSKITIGDGLLGDTSVGHLTIADQLAAYANTDDAIVGWRGENPSSRVLRLVETEEGVPFQLQSRGLSGNTMTMGLQGLKTLVDMAREVETSDLGILYEPRDEIGLAYRTRLSLYNQDPKLALDYAQNELASAPIPVDDDRYTVNNVTVTREFGTLYNTALDTGTLSTQVPPDGVGLYEENVTISLGTDALLPYQAGWRLHLGTIDEARYPQIEMNLRHSTFTSSAAMMDAALEMDIGDRVTIDNPPDWLPPDRIDLLAVGFTETLGALERDITVNCVSESAYHVTYVEGDDYERADTDGSTVAADITSSSTSVSVTTQADSALWADSATYASDFPFDVRCGGEVMTAAACTSGVKDDFSAAQTDTWGSPDIGSAWANTGGVAADFDVLSGYGRHIVTAANTALFSTTTAPGADFDLYCDMTTAALSTGASQFTSIVARYTNTSNHYHLRAEYTTANAINLEMYSAVAGVSTQLDSYSTGLTHVAGTYLRARFQGHGTTLRGRIWVATAREPSEWHVEAVNSSLTSAGSVGVRSRRDVGNTNASADIRFDNFDLVNPQTFTVTRSVNGVTKAQTAGTDVRLAYPAIISL